MSARDRPERTWRRILVLDLETSPDPVVAGRVRDGVGPRSSMERVALHRLDAFAALTVEEDGALGVRSPRLVSASSADGAEHAMLAACASALASVRDGGLLCTFNGEAHDLPFLRHRLMATGDLRTAGHVMAGERTDVMVEWAGGGRLPRLADLCAALDLPVWKDGRLDRGVAGRAAKSRLDVCATFVLSLHLRAAALGLTSRAIVPAWRAMSAAVLAGGVDDPRLLALLRHPRIVRTG